MVTMQSEQIGQSRVWEGCTNRNKESPEKQTVIFISLYHHRLL